MTSLIFGAIYMTHKGATGAYRDKQRRKAYERWEGLRDEYDAQKKITRETRSLDIQRTASGEAVYDDRPIMTLRDLQEANDARTGWRPQESWEPSLYASSSVKPTTETTAPPSAQSHTYSQPQFDAHGRAVSVPSAYWAGRGEIRPQKTGAAWDDELPAPLRVSRRSFEDHDLGSYRHDSRERLGSVDERTMPRRSSKDVSPFSSQANSQRPSREASQVRTASVAEVPKAPHQLSELHSFSVEPVENVIPGGPMAQLVASEPQYPPQPEHHQVPSHFQPQIRPQLQHEFQSQASFTPSFPHSTPQQSPFTQQTPFSLTPFQQPPNQYFSPLASPPAVSIPTKTPMAPMFNSQTPLHQVQPSFQSQAQPPVQNQPGGPMAQLIEGGK